MDNYQQAVIAFMAKHFGLSGQTLNEDQEYDLLMQFEDCEEYQTEFRATH